jgi:hypothetical protein
VDFAAVAPGFQFAAQSVSVNENVGAALITVIRGGDTRGPLLFPMPRPTGARLRTLITRRQRHA